MRFSLLAAVLLTVVGCAQRHHSAPAPDVPQTSVILIWVDGISQRVFDELVAAGELPKLERTFVQQGRVFRNTIVTLPSLTYINAAGMLTGCLPHQHGIYGNRWYDPQTGIFRDYETVSGFDKINVDLQVPTVHEHIRKQPTLSVQCHTQRGADYKRNNVITSGLSWLFEDWAAVERNAAREAEFIAGLPPQQWPGLALFYFPTADANAHAHGLEDEYRSALRRIDQQVGVLIRTLKDARPPGRSLHFVLATDHGQMAIPSEQRFELEAWCRTQGIEGRWIIGAPRRAVIHLPPETDAWTWLGQNEDVQQLPGLDLLVGRQGEAIELRHAEGRTRIERGDEGWRLRLLEGEPGPDFGPYDRWLKGDAWLRETGAGRYPDLVPQLWHYFYAPRSGDLLLFAKPGWGWDHTPAGHGGVAEDEMRVSLTWHGPGVAAGQELTPIRLIDLTPTILDLLDEQGGEALSGRSFRKRLGL